MLFEPLEFIGLLDDLSLKISKRRVRLGKPAVFSLQLDSGDKIGQTALDLDGFEVHEGHFWQPQGLVSGFLGHGLQSRFFRNTKSEAGVIPALDRVKFSRIGGEQNFLIRSRTEDVLENSQREVVTL